LGQHQAKIRKGLEKSGRKADGGQTWTTTNGPPEEKPYGVPGGPEKGVAKGINLNELSQRGDPNPGKGAV